MTLSSAMNGFGYAGLRSDKKSTTGPTTDRSSSACSWSSARAAALKFRMDDRKQRIVVSAEETAEGCSAGRSTDAAALDALAGRLEAARVAGRARSRRRWRRCAACATPSHSQDPAGTGSRHSTGRSGRRAVRAGTVDLGLPHRHARHGPRRPACESIDDLRWFYQDVLGFRLSDYILKPFKAYFFHVNPRHHSLALIETGRDGIHHIMMELLSLDDVGQAYDIASPSPTASASRSGATPTIS